MDHDKTNPPSEAADTFEHGSSSDEQLHYPTEPGGLPPPSANNTLLKHALWYVKHGLPVIPVSWDEEHEKRKTPLIAEWSPYKTRLPTEEEVTQWWTRWPDAGIAMLTGALSGIIVLDEEAEADRNFFGFAEGLETPMVKSGRGGRHFWFAHEPQRNRTKFVPNHDFRGDDGYVLVPPSPHESGGIYEWIIPFGSVPLMPLSDNVRKALAAPKMKSGQDIAGLLHGVTMEGGRNDAAASIAGSLLSKYPPRDWETKVWPLLRGWNTNHAQPPLKEDELRRTYTSIANAELSKRKPRMNVEEKADGSGTTDGVKSSKAKIARELIEFSGMRLFHDEFGKSYAKFKHHGHFEIWPCESSDFRLWVSYYCYQQKSSPASSEELNDIIGVLNAKALFDGELAKVHLRTGSDKENIFYDLADEQWRAIRISADGWSIVSDPPVHFRRYKHTGSQILPEHDGDAKRIFDFILIEGDDERLLFLCLLATSFIPDTQHPILLLSGSKGSAKTTIAEMVKTLVDPSPIMRLPFPTSYSDLAIILNQSWCVSFDNVSWIDEWLSDALCKAVTGDAFTKRRLYTDDDAIVVAYQRCVVMNGLNVPAEKADLIDRILFFATKPIPSSERKGLHRLRSEFMKAAPSILGGIFDLISRAMAVHPTLAGNDLSRLADFDLWGRAVAVALGYSEDGFKRALASNIDRQNDEALHQSVVATAVLGFISGQTVPIWEGTPNYLLEKLEQVAISLHIDTRAKHWPKSPSHLSRKLNEIAGNLLEAGILLTHRHDGTQRTIRLEKKLPNGVSSISVVSQVGDTDLTPNDANGTNDASMDNGYTPPDIPF